MQVKLTKPRLSFWQLWNMTFGFCGIQFGWALQMANMGPIYEYLGAKADEIPILFLAAPLTGLIVQPIIGYLSDRTWHPIFGRRRPYFMIGAILSSIALVFMPNSSTLWMAAGLLWIMDSSINISMEPFRAFVADKLPAEQLSVGFSMQSLFIGLGQIIANALPWLMSHVFEVSSKHINGNIPDSVKYSFYIGAAAFLGTVMYTVFTSKEYPPTETDLNRPSKKENLITEVFHALTHMPPRMQQIALVQFFTWPGLFLMWFYYSAAVARDVFQAPSEKSDIYTKGVEFAGLTLSFYNLITFLFALVLPLLAVRFGKRKTHMLCLLTGGLGLISVRFVTQPELLFVSMACIGIAWASILSMPYAILAGCLPENKVGIYMGIFNFFIVLPEIIASLFFGWIMSHVLNNDRMLAVQVGGFLMLLAALLCLRIKDE